MKPSIDFGLWAGSWMALARTSVDAIHLARPDFDGVPERLAAHARWYLPWRYGLWRGTNPGGELPQTIVRLP